MKTLSGSCLLYTSALSIIVDYDMVKGDHTYAKVTGNEPFCTHNPEGNILYGIEVFIHPDYRGLSLARRMYCLLYTSSRLMASANLTDGSCLLGLGVN